MKFMPVSLQLARGGPTKAKITQSVAVNLIMFMTHLRMQWLTDCIWLFSSPFCYVMVRGRSWRDYHDDPLSWTSGSAGRTPFVGPPLETFVWFGICYSSLQQRDLHLSKLLRDAGKPTPLHKSDTDVDGEHIARCRLRQSTSWTWRAR